jgi:D-alanine-D-alanine ligase
MTQSNKVRVAVLYGGRSGEHEVSLRSAMNVIKNLDRTRYEVVPIGIDKQGAWYLGEDINHLSMDETLRLTSDREKMLFTPALIGKPPLDNIAAHLNKSESLFDVVFPVIHGVLCEDGTVQGFLELADVPYVGCGVLSSAIGMDKDVSKRLISNAGLLVPPYLVIKAGHWQHNPEKFLNLVSTKLTYPVFVKPANTGSSVGVHRVKNARELPAAIADAFRYDTKILVEQGIDAMELEVSVLESKEYGGEPIVSVIGEIRPQNGHEFYSYESKYLDEDGAELIIPAPIPDAVRAEIQALAKVIFAVLECEGMARVDLFLEKKTNRIYFNEINTIPGFTAISMYPKLLAASGMKYQELLSHLIELAIARHSRNSKLSREYLLPESRKVTASS